MKSVIIFNLIAFHCIDSEKFNKEIIGIVDELEKEQTNCFYNIEGDMIKLYYLMKLEGNFSEYDDSETIIKLVKKNMTNEKDWYGFRIGTTKFFNSFNNKSIDINFVGKLWFECKNFDTIEEVNNYCKERIVNEKLIRLKLDFKTACHIYTLFIASYV